MNDTAPALGTVAPTALVATRVELHWLAQVVGAAGDALLSHMADDSHSNMAWDARHGALLGHRVGRGAAIGLVIESAELIVVDAASTVYARTSARGQTLPALLRWAGHAMAEASGVTPAATPTRRDYAMPNHPVAGGAAFAFPNRAALSELSHWYAAAGAWLDAARGLDARAGEVRCWPHHFDVGGIYMLEPNRSPEEARQLGFGWSPGDETYTEPYFYVTPFPVPRKLPELELGHWHTDGFVGAILTGDEVTVAEARAEQAARVERFLRTTVERTLPLIES